MIELIFQNNETGQLVDLSTVAKQFSLKTSRRGVPAKLEIDLVYDMPFPFGSPIKVLSHSKPLFFGTLFRVKKTKQNQRTLIFYDQTKYLLRQMSYMFKAKNMKDIVTAIAKDFELKTGDITAPADPLPALLKEDKTALDIIQDAMDEVFMKTGQLLVFWDDFGSLRMNTPANLRIHTVLADMSIISDYEYEGSIEDSANMIKIVKDNKDVGKREVFLFQDSVSIKKWGKLQEFVKVDEKLNEAQIKERGDVLLKLKNRVYETVKLEFSVGNFDFRAGYSVFVDVKDVGVSGWYVLEDVEHTVTPTKHTMTVTLFIAGGVS